MYPEIYNPSRYHHNARWKVHSRVESFTCIQCDARVHTQPEISGVKNRNHCPYCLCSRHVDHLRTGDRLSACKAVMQPIGLAAKPGRNKYSPVAYGELMLIHRCAKCGKLSINRLAADDQLEILLEIFQASLGFDASIQEQLTLGGIHLLQSGDSMMVIRQLKGIERI